MEHDFNERQLNGPTTLFQEDSAWRVSAVGSATRHGRRLQLNRSKTKSSTIPSTRKKTLHFTILHQENRKRRQQQQQQQRQQHPLVFVAGADVRFGFAAVHGGVAQAAVVGGHVDFGADARTLALLRALDHLLPHRQVLGHVCVPWKMTFQNPSRKPSNRTPSYRVLLGFTSSSGSLSTSRSVWTSRASETLLRNGLMFLPSFTQFYLVLRRFAKFFLVISSYT